LRPGPRNSPPPAETVPQLAPELGCRGPGKANFPIWEAGLPTIQVKTVRHGFRGLQQEILGGCTSFGPASCPNWAGTLSATGWNEKGEWERRAEGGVRPNPSGSGRAGLLLFDIVDLFAPPA
jgi:hypothetical protein